MRNNTCYLLQRCLLLVNFDIDAICTCKILQHLFKNDNMLYTLVPVQGIQDMVQAFEDNCEEVNKKKIKLTPNN